MMAARLLISKLSTQLASKQYSSTSSVQLLKMRVYSQRFQQLSTQTRSSTLRKLKNLTLKERAMAPSSDRRKYCYQHNYTKSEMFREGVL